MDYKLKVSDEGYVETNIGKVPVKEYLDIQAMQYGFSSYADLRKAGYHIAGVDKEIESTFYLI